MITQQLEQRKYIYLISRGLDVISCDMESVVRDLAMRALTDKLHDTSTWFTRYTEALPPPPPENNFRKTRTETSTAPPLTNTARTPQAQFVGEKGYILFRYC